MHERRLQAETEPKIVVRGTPRLAEVWPSERPEPVPGSPRSVGELGDPDEVVALLAAVEAEEPAAYRDRYRLSGPSVRALAAHCRAAVLEAAMRVDGDLSPEAVLEALHEGLRRPIEPLLERLAS